MTPEQLETLASEGRLGDAVLPVGNLLRLPRVTLDPDAAAAFRHGSARPIVHGGVDEGRVAVFEEAELIGIGSVAAGVLQPQKVLPA
jgi:hypothetical protein